MDKSSASFENLIVWQKAHEFVLKVYKLTEEECRYYLILTKDLNYKEDVHKEIGLLVEVSKLLNGYCKTILNSLTS